MEINEKMWIKMMLCAGMCVCVCVYVNTSGCNAKIEQSVAGNLDYFGSCAKAAET